jgi:hypothetical protein
MAATAWCLPDPQCLLRVRAGQAWKIGKQTEEQVKHGINEKRDTHYTGRHYIWSEKAPLPYSVRIWLTGKDGIGKYIDLKQSDAIKMVLRIIWIIIKSFYRRHRI